MMITLFCNLNFDCSLQNYAFCLKDNIYLLIVTIFNLKVLILKLSYNLVLVDLKIGYAVFKSVIQ